MTLEDSTLERVQFTGGHDGQDHRRCLSFSAPAGLRLAVEPSRTRVLCVDDSPDLTRVLGLLISLQPDLESVGALDRADNLVEEVARYRADVVVLDLNMPGTPPLAALRELTARVPECRVVVYSGHCDQEGREDSMKAGAFACVSKLHDPFEVIMEIRRAVM